MLVLQCTSLFFCTLDLFNSVHDLYGAEIGWEMFCGSLDCVGDAVQKPAEITIPVLSLTEEINAEFEGLSLICVGLQGSLQLRTPLPKSKNDKDIEFSFSLNQVSSIKVCCVQSLIDPISLMIYSFCLCHECEC